MRRIRGVGIAFVLSLLGWSGAATCQQFSHGSSDGTSYSQPKAPLSAAQVANNLQERNLQRAAALNEFSSRRVYRMQYRGFFSDRDAEMVIDVTFRAPNTKQFRVVSQSGSKFVIDHVFKRLLDSEQEDVNEENRQHTELNTENYDFALAGYEATAQGAQYVLTLIPKNKNRFLYRGKIWVDAKDFAVVRIEAEPAKNPSIWIKNTEIEHRYMKVNDFWLPVVNHTESVIRFGGRAILSIEYKDYKITRAAPLSALQNANSSSK
ncbi:MAG: hypothetical protein WB660_18905 [Candidatus Sulfotelmatobacter sp.]